LCHKSLSENSKLSKIFNFIPAFVSLTHFQFLPMGTQLKGSEDWVKNDIPERSKISFNQPSSRLRPAQSAIDLATAGKFRTSAQEIDQNRNLINFRISSK
ncbi:MAG TPA: hypothetical protein VJJ26_01505, partial [Candidatus Babeliales bacterium]|nr:hypothetical protein [Candidatus Babeliales bacterium]